MFQTTFGRHTVLPCPPHLRKRQADVHMFIVQSVSFVDGERNKPRVLAEFALGEREQERPVLVRLVLLLLGLW